MEHAAINMIIKIMLSSIVVVLIFGYNSLYFIRSSGSDFFPEHQNWWHEFYSVNLMGLQVCCRSFSILICVISAFIASLFFIGYAGYKIFSQ